MWFFIRVLMQCPVLTCPPTWQEGQGGGSALQKVRGHPTLESLSPLICAYCPRYLSWSGLSWTLALVLGLLHLPLGPDVEDLHLQRAWKNTCCDLLSHTNASWGPQAVEVTQKWRISWEKNEHSKGGDIIREALVQMHRLNVRWSRFDLFRIVQNTTTRWFQRHWRPFAHISDLKNHSIDVAAKRKKGTSAAFICQYSTAFRCSMTFFWPTATWQFIVFGIDSSKALSLSFCLSVSRSNWKRSRVEVKNKCPPTASELRRRRWAMCSKEGIMSIYL